MASTDSMTMVEGDQCPFCARWELECEGGHIFASDTTAVAVERDEHDQRMQLLNRGWSTTS